MLISDSDTLQQQFGLPSYTLLTLLGAKWGCNVCEGLPPFAAKFLNFTIGQLQIEIIRRDPKI